VCPCRADLGFLPTRYDDTQVLAQIAKRTALQLPALEMRSSYAAVQG
jgi:hypothetical protein